MTIFKKKYLSLFKNSDYNLKKIICLYNSRFLNNIEELVLDIAPGALNSPYLYYEPMYFLISDNVHYGGNERK